MKDLFSEVEEKEEIDETIREVCENEDRFNSEEYYKECKDAEKKKLFIESKRRDHENSQMPKM
jgi:hypothetical protein